MVVTMCCVSQTLGPVYVQEATHLTLIVVLCNPFCLVCRLVRVFELVIAILSKGETVYPTGTGSHSFKADKKHELVFGLRETMVVYQTLHPLAKFHVLYTTWRGLSVLMMPQQFISSSRGSGSSWEIL